MIEIPLEAFKPFFSETVEIQAPKGRNDYAPPFTCRAIVQETDPYSLAFGEGADGQGVGYAVAVPLEDLQGRIVPEGSRITAPNRPRLFVQSVHRCGPLLHLDCTALERGRA